MSWVCKCEPEGKQYTEDEEDSVLVIGVKYCLWLSLDVQEAL